MDRTDRTKLPVFLASLSMAALSQACVVADSDPEEGLETTAEVSQELVTGRYARAWAWVDRNDGVLPATYESHLRVERLDTYPYKQYSSSGTATVTHLATGYWRVTFPNIAVSGGTVHVSAYAGAHHCKVSSWGQSGNNMDVYARCFNAAGAPVDGRFTVLFYRDDPGKSSIYGNAYVWADNPTAASYTPSTTYQFNSRGAVNTITRSGPGAYQVRLPRMERHWLESNHGGTVQVTAYGAGPERCKVRSWGQSGNDILVNVGCMNGATAADSRFTLSWMREPGGFAKFVAEDTEERFYVWGNATPTPSDFYQSDSYGNGGATMEFFAPNTYRVHLPYVKAYNSTNAQVTAYGSGNAYCTIGGWYAAASGTTVDVRCYDAAGSPTASMFTLLYSTNNIIFY